MNHREPWFDPNLEADRRHSELFGTVRALHEKQQHRLELDRWHLQLFCDMGYVGYQQGIIDSLNDILSGRLDEKLIHRIVTTGVNKVVKHQPWPKFWTDGADWSAQQEVVQREKYVHGTMQRLKFAKLRDTAVMHAAITGTGLLHVFPSDGRVDAEVVPSWEVWVDPAEAQYDVMGVPPPNVYRITSMDIEVLKRLFPDAPDSTTETGGGDDSDLTAVMDVLYDDRSRRRTVIEAWHPPSSFDEDAEPGRHVIATSGGVLLDEAWQRPLPFAKMTWFPRPAGYFGIGYPELLASQQIELNRALWFRQETMKLMASPFWFIKRGSAVVLDKLKETLIGRVIEGNEAPHLMEPPGANATLFAHGDAVRASMFQSSGVSQLSAQSLKPLGIDSAIGLRTLSLIEDQNLHQQIQGMTDMVMEFAERVLDVTQELVNDEDAESIKELFEGDGEIEAVNWSGGFDRAMFRVKTGPVNAVSASFAGDAESVTDLMNAGILTDKTEARKLLGLPDEKAARDEALSADNVAHRIIEVEILSKGREDVEPDDLWPLELMQKQAIGALMDVSSKPEKARPPESHIEALRIFIAKVQASLERVAQEQAEAAQAAQAQQQPQGPQGPEPPAGPPGPAGVQRAA